MSENTNRRLPDFDEWTPAEHLDAVYDIDDIVWKEGWICFTLIPDGADRVLRSHHKLLLCWEGFVSYQITQENVREDCWISAPQKPWTFYVSDHSDRLRAFRESSCLFPPEAKHFVLGGTNLVADIFATEYPVVKIIPD